MKTFTPNSNRGFSLEAALLCVAILFLIGGCVSKIIIDARKHAHPRRLPRDGDASDPETNKIAFPTAGNWELLTSVAIQDVAESYSLPVVVTVKMNMDQNITLAIAVAPPEDHWTDPLNLRVATGLTGVPVTLQFSTDMANWNDLVQMMVTPGTSLDVTDDIPPAGQGFYRTVKY